ncbi:formate/nitrite transporter family protein [Amaricoccus tamworthensis]|uniref:formate/nitrite transporter family protein n=1 Tax=Amaricoccus tamworthensis TaxID=57002 RepID=UPI003C79FE2E
MTERRGLEPTLKEHSENPEPQTDVLSARAEERQTRQDTPSAAEEPLTREERDHVSKNRRLSSLTVYSVVLKDGEEELDRPKTSLWWSGVAAGIAISSSVLAEGVIRSGLGADHPYLHMIESFGYSFGFVLVIMSRLQLFTENTITVVLPVLAAPSRNNLYCSLRLWAIVFLANMVGTSLTAAIAVHGGVLPLEVLEAIVGISREVAELDPGQTLLRGIPAGFLIAALVWMLPSARGTELFIIVMVTWLIAAGGFTHVVVGSNEIFTLVFSGELTVFSAFIHHILPTLIGNVFGGTGLFAMLAYGQISQEM